MCLPAGKTFMDLFIESIEEAETRGEIRGLEMASELMPDYPALDRTVAVPIEKWIDGIGELLNDARGRLRSDNAC